MTLINYGLAGLLGVLVALAMYNTRVSLTGAAPIPSDAQVQMQI